jgi:hypothetical protein
MQSCQRVLCNLAVSASFAAVTVIPSIAAAQFHYRLAPESAYEEGCFAPCLCPVMMRSGVSGTFVAVLLEPDGSYRVFAIQQVRWSVPDPRLLVRGSGTYRIDAAGLVQRLELDLQVGEIRWSTTTAGSCPCRRSSQTSMSRSRCTACTAGTPCSACRPGSCRASRAHGTL